MDSGDGQHQKPIYTLANERVHIFQEQLLQWYAQHGRDLPWRNTRDPYCILVSEMMLQQTQVKRVLPKYLEWLQIYPTFETLAVASLEDVKEKWKPLGYNIRPERLHEIAQFVVSKCNGHLPETLEELMAFSGIGRATAGAILSFAFHKDAPIVDTNIQRVILRIFGIHDDPKHAKVEKTIWKLAEVLLPKGLAYIFNQAIFDFGALICTAQNPSCSSCFNYTACPWYACHSK